jgi:arylsulfatase A-like enzyme
VCAVPVPDIVEGKSLLPLIEGTESDIRDVVFSEYLENEEAMVRTQRYKFVYITGKRERQDGYKTGRPLPGRMRILFDILNDPNEFINLADRPEYRETVDKFQREMLRRFEETSPARAAIPSGVSVEDQLDYYLQPRDGK